MCYCYCLLILQQYSHGVLLLLFVNFTTVQSRCVTVILYQIFNIVTVCYYSQLNSTVLVIVKSLCVTVIVC